MTRSRAALCAVGLLGCGVADEPALRLADSGALDAGAEAVEDGGLTDAALPLDAGPQPIVGDDYLRIDGLRVRDSGLLAVEFDVPEDAVSFVLTAAPRSARGVYLISLRGPEQRLYDIEQVGSTEAGVEPGEVFSPNATRNLDDFSPFSLAYPNRPELVVASGPHELILLLDRPIQGASGDDSALVDFDVVFKREATGSTNLSIALWFAPGASLDADAALGDPGLSEALGIASEIFAAVDIALSDIVFGDLPGSEELAAIDDEAELQELLTLLDVEAGRVLHIVFVDSLPETPGRTVRAKTTGLPGPPAHPALERSGAVVVSLEHLPDDEQRLAEMLSHEACHYLALRHTSEFDGARHDPIADTPQCPGELASRRRSDGTPILSAEDCVELGGDNLLFYTPPLGTMSQSHLSPQQAEVIRLSPLVR